MRRAAKHPHHHAEAVIERHGNAHTVGLGVVAALADEVAVVQDVGVCERRPFGKPGRSRRVLDVDGFVGVEASRTGRNLVRTDRLGPGDQVAPVVSTNEIDLLEARDVRPHLFDHRDVVAGLEVRGRHEPSTTGLFEGVLHLMGPVGGVDADHDDADAGGGQLGQHPLDVVGRPDAEPIAFLETSSHQAPSDGVHLVPELTVGPADRLEWHDERLAVRVLLGRPSQVVADRFAQQWGIGRTHGLTR